LQLGLCQSGALLLPLTVTVVLVIDFFAAGLRVVHNGIVVLAPCHVAL
jgi:hypothetical protein